MKKKTKKKLLILIFLLIIVLLIGLVIYNIYQNNILHFSNIKDKEIYVGEQFDYKKGIKCTNKNNKEFNIELMSKFDNKKVGNYKIKLKCGTGKFTIYKTYNLKVKKKKEINKIENKSGLYYINDILIVNKTYSISSTYNPNGLLKEFLDNFQIMKNEASKENINLSVISGFRSYEKQSIIYNNYVNKDGKEEADTYSARPGHSEHQTGLAADINKIDRNFDETKEGKWLNENCYKYGFIIRYPKGKEIFTGYIYEPWHIRYVGNEASQKLYNNGNWISLEEYLKIESKYE